MLSCAALERSNNSYIESIVKPCVSKNQKEIFVMWVWLGKKSWKRLKVVEKRIHEQEAELVYLCVREKKQLWDYCNHFKVYKKCIFLQFKKDFKIAELLPKHAFFFTLETVLKMAKETNKGDFESICTKLKE